MTLSDLSPPVGTPVSAVDLAAHLRLSSGFADDGSEDAILDIYIRAATTAVERRTSRALIERPMLWRLATRPHGPIYAPVAPISAVSSAAHVDAEGQATALDPGLVVLQKAVSPPVVDLSRLPPPPDGGYLEIGLTAGYGPTSSDIPADIRQAVLLLAAHYYEHRDQSGGDAAVMPPGVISLIEPHRPVRL